MCAAGVAGLGNDVTSHLPLVEALFAHAVVVDEAGDVPVHPGLREGEWCRLVSKVCVNARAGCASPLRCRAPTARPAPRAPQSVHSKHL
jgi:hypothetical protein